MPTRAKRSRSRTSKSSNHNRRSRSVTAMSHWTRDQNGGKEVKSASRTRARSNSRKKKTECVAPYNSYGRSTDPNYNLLPFKLREPNPYLEMEKDLTFRLPNGPFTPRWLAKANDKLRARLKLIIEKNHEKALQYAKVQKSQTAGEDSRPQIDAKTSDGGGDGSQQTETVDDILVKGEEEESPVPDEDEDDEEERGVPQAVRLPDIPTHPPTIIEVIRERQKALMEEVAREVDQKDLIRHLRTRGFFNYNYCYHQRAKRTDVSLNGEKRAVQKLVSLLAG